MKHCKFLPLLLLLAGCSSASPTLVDIELLIVPDGSIRIGSDATNASGTIDKLGPADQTRVNIRACSTAKARDVIETKKALENAGYKHFAFSTIGSEKDARCAN